MKNNTIKGLLELYRTKNTNPIEVIKLYIKHSKAVNPTLNALLTICENEALEQINNLKDTDLPLYGIPFTMKDTFMTKGIKTTAGSNVLSNYIAQYDATVYKELKNAGAILIGKANCDAWGHGSSTENSDFGCTKNPWDTKYVAGGSSGGSAASVSSGMGIFSIGEDTGGSIRLPAAFCGTYGLKVTYGLVSRYGSIAYASSLDTVGPIAQSVEDIAQVLQVIAGTDPYDATSVRASTPNYYDELRKNMGTIKGTKIGIPKEYFIDGLDSEIKQKTESFLKELEKNGAELINVSLPSTKYSISAYYLIAPSETSSNLARFDGIRYGNDRSHFGAEAKRRMMLGSFTLSSGYYDDYYLKATKIRTLIKQDFENVFKKVDFIVAPTSPTPPFLIGEKMTDPLSMYLSDIFTIPVNLAGIPALSIPIGFTEEKLPLGIQLIGNIYEESKILSVGNQIEKVLGESPKVNEIKL